MKGLNMLHNIGVAMLSQDTYTKFQRLYLIPALTAVWNRHPARIVQDARDAGGHLRLAWDARYDSAQQFEGCLIFVAAT